MASDDLRPAGDFIALQAPNALGEKPVVRGRKKKPRYVSKADAREVITDFVLRNSHVLQSWLEEIYQENGAKAAFEATISLLEFSVPKLSRREVTGADEGPVELKVTWAEEK